MIPQYPIIILYLPTLFNVIIIGAFDMLEGRKYNKICREMAEIWFISPSLNEILVIVQKLSAFYY